MTNLGSIKKLRAVSKKLYIYGAGQFGQVVYRILQRENIAIDGFVVTVQDGETSLFGWPILEFKTIKDQDIGIVVGVDRSNVESIKEVLRSEKFNMKRVAWGHELIDKRETTVNYERSVPMIEITTRIGCKVNCKFCPQSTLIQKYFENDAGRASVMSMETFSKCLEKLPQDCMVLFCGMAEPFLNPQCLEMIKLAVSSGRTVNLCTTLVGADMSLVKQLCEIPFGFITMHLADKYGFASIPVSEVYYKMVEMLINLKKENGNPVVDTCNAQAEPDERLLAICEGEYEIWSTMMDRAGNLNDPQLQKSEYLSGPLSCKRCGPKLDHNILLPDGTLLLCCMDYGMKHVLGNLLENSYEEILNGDAMGKIKRNMSEEDGDVLCRYCISACPRSKITQ